MPSGFSIQDREIKCSLNPPKGQSCKSLNFPATLIGPRGPLTGHLVSSWPPDFRRPGKIFILMSFPHNPFISLLWSLGPAAMAPFACPTFPFLNTGRRFSALPEGAPAWRTQAVPSLPSSPVNTACIFLAETGGEHGSPLCSLPCQHLLSTQPGRAPGRWLY